MKVIKQRFVHFFFFKFSVLIFTSVLKVMLLYFCLPSSRLSEIRELSNQEIGNEILFI